MAVAVSCPNCGAALHFSSPALPLRTCDSCHSLILNKAEGLERIGDAAVLPFDISPIEIGTTGRHGGQGFTIVGRVRWEWDAGSWNEWLALFADGSNGWLAEAMGDFMLLRERSLDSETDPTIQALSSGAPAQLGAHAQIDGQSYFVTDIKQARMLACEGELPFKASADWTVDSVDLRTTSTGCASFQKDADGPSLYVGETVSLADLGAANLRAIEGWTMPVFAAR